MMNFYRNITLFFGGLLMMAFFQPVLADRVTANDFRNSGFRGFDIGWLKHGVRSNADINAMAQNGANLARVFVSIERCESCLKYEIPSADLVTLDLLIDRLATRSIKVVIVLDAKEDSRGALWDSTSLRNSLIMQWKLLATRYRGNPNIAGFDLLNEPVPPGKLPNYSDRQPIWLAYAEEIGLAIRSIDTDRVLIVESAPDSTPPSFQYMKPLPLKNVVYSFHSYLPIGLTHQNVMKGYSQPLTYGSTDNMNVNRKDLYKLLKNVENFQIMYNVPIFVGEFSCARWAPNGSAIRYVSDSVAFFEAKGWSWAYHEFRGWPGWDAEVASEDPNSALRSSNSPIIKLLRAQMLSNKK